MKKIITSLTTAIILLSSCVDNVYINGNLDGMWKLQKIEESGKEPLYPLNIFYSFQRNLSFLSLTYEEKLPERLLGNLSYEKEKSITLWGFRNVYGEKEITMQELNKYMIFNEYTTFTIEKIDSKQLIMHNNGRCYHLEKW